MSTPPRIFITGQIYHVYNRGINGHPIFQQKKHFNRAMLALDYYRFSHSQPGLASYLVADPFTKELIRANHKKSGALVEVLAFCLMPNHYHLLLRQTQDFGISTYISQFQNSHTKFFNHLNSRTGPLFTGPFKAVAIEDQLQLLHTSRYIHLNPYVSNVVKNIDQLISYSWSSLPEYAGRQAEIFIDPSLILQSFDNRESYMQYLFDRSDYQKRLSAMKHLMLEAPINYLQAS